MRYRYTIIKKFPGIPGISSGEKVSNLRAMYDGLGEDIHSKFPNTSIMKASSTSLVMEIEEEDVDGIRTLFRCAMGRLDTPIVPTI